MLEYILPAGTTGEQADEIIDAVRLLDPDAHLSIKYHIYSTTDEVWTVIDVFLLEAA